MAFNSRSYGIQEDRKTLRLQDRVEMEGLGQWTSVLGKHPRILDYAVPRCRTLGVWSWELCDKCPLPLKIPWAWTVNLLETSVGRGIEDFSLTSPSKHTLGSHSNGRIDNCSKE